MYVALSTYACLCRLQAAASVACFNFLEGMLVDEIDDFSLSRGDAEYEGEVWGNIRDPEGSRRSDRVGCSRKPPKSAPRAYRSLNLSP